jgi:hypothetical protein
MGHAAVIWKTQGGSIEDRSSVAIRLHLIFCSAYCVFRGTYRRRSPCTTALWADSHHEQRIYDGGRGHQKEERKDLLAAMTLIIPLFTTLNLKWHIHAAADMDRND